MKGWHILRRSVEEAAILVEEARRYERNLVARIVGLYEAACQNHIIKLDYLKWAYLYAKNKPFLKEILKKTPPTWNSNAEDDDLVVIFLNDRVHDDLFLPRLLDNHQVNQEGVVDDEDNVEGDDAEDGRGEDDRGYDLVAGIATTLAYLKVLLYK